MTTVTGSEQPVMDARVGLGRSMTLAIMGVATLGLLACSDSSDQPPPAKVSETPAPVAQPAATPDAAPGAGDMMKDPAVPDTASTDAKSPDPSRPMSKQEESTQMPLPGQANDHSNPTTGPAKAPSS
ncbi:MAG TPA: hypothetical protein VLU54_06225 [Casimicrobiaceae bacterium]|nr:hypothetical protein [Casimicrobiaceae bacterium]